MNFQPSDKWLEQYNNTLVPEMFVLITYHVSDDKAQTDAIASSVNQVSFSSTSSVTDLDASSPASYATGEPNLWVLDGSKVLVPDSEPYENAGYVSMDCVSDANHPIITFSFSKTHAEKIPGVTIVWSSILNEFAKSFKLTAYNGSEIVASKQINDNRSVESSVDFEVSGYDSINLEVLEWCIPERRARVEQVEFGQRIRFSKADLLSYTHESKRDPISGQLSKDSVSFSVDNSEQRWNPVNPGGLYKYLYERQEISVQYGMDIGDAVEWIDGGKFFLSGWTVPANGITASFDARDALSFLQDSIYTGHTSGTLYQMCFDALELLDVPGISYEISEELKNYSCDISSDASSYKNADVLQLAANAAGMALYQSRDGVIHIERVPLVPVTRSGIEEISLLNSFKYPEITFSTKIKNVSCKVGSESVFYPAGASGNGATQSINNPLVSKSVSSSAKNALTETYALLSNRRKVNLEFRASPHIDALSFVRANHQFGYASNVLVTDAKYTFNGCFKGTIEGYMVESASALRLDKDSVFVAPGETVRLTATLVPSSEDSPAIGWEASPPGVVSISVVSNKGGVSACDISFISSGDAVVTAFVSSVSAKCAVISQAPSLSDMPEGSSVYIQESGADVEFVVAKHGYEPNLNGPGRTLFIRKEPLAETVWNQTHVNTYDGSSIDRLLNGDYKNKFNDAVKSAMGLTSFYYTVGGSTTEIRTISRSVFLPSIYEMFDPDDKNADVYVNGSNPFFKKEGSVLPKQTRNVFVQSYEDSLYHIIRRWSRSPALRDHDGNHIVGQLVGTYSLGTSNKGNAFFFTEQYNAWSSNKFSPAFTLPSTTKVGNGKKILL
nr:MAG TPA: hypothetical protein [Caudoviricetes sp.]